jgi:hypothetical protein
MIEQEPFRKYHDKKKADTFTTRVNDEERAILEWTKDLFELPREKSDSKAWKFLALIGYDVLHGKKLSDIIRVTLKRRLRE